VVFQTKTYLVQGPIYFVTGRVSTS